MGQKIGRINGGWPYYRGRLKFHDLRTVIAKYTVHRICILEQLFALIGTSGVKISRAVIEKTT